MINIEPAKSQHIEDLLSLNDLVQKQHADSLPEIFKYPVDSLALKEEYLSNIFSDDHYIYVALINEKVIGYLWAEHIRRNEYSGQVFLERY